MTSALTTLLFPLGFPELIVILLIVLVVFGANKLPGIGDALGRSIKNFKRSSKVDDADDELEDKDAKDKKVLAAGASQKQLDKGATGSDDGEWEEVVVRRRKKSANTAD
jgi:sec-independent protein translocase protein TatA